MSTNETGFIKILALILVLGASTLSSGCAEDKKQSYKNKLSNQADSQILNGEEVTPLDPVSKKALYLATGAQLIKTPKGYSASQKGQCTAVAILPNVILTAGHCVIAEKPEDNQTADSVFVILGNKPWKAKFDPNLWYAVDEIKVIDTYGRNKSGGSENDLALLKLKRPLPSEYVTELATEVQLFPVMDFMMAGYGLRSNLAELNPEQEKKNLGELYRTYKILEDYELNSPKILIDQTDMKGICSGDSGGPGLIYDQSQKKYYVLGIVSGTKWLESDKNKFDPENKVTCFGTAVYTNVLFPEYLDWIKKTSENFNK